MAVLGDGQGALRSKMTGRDSTCGIQQVGDDLEAVALINEKLLPLSAVVHLLGILGHQCVEESIVLLSSLCACINMIACLID